MASLATIFAARTILHKSEEVGISNPFQYLPPELCIDLRNRFGVIRLKEVAFLADATVRVEDISCILELVVVTVRMKHKRTKLPLQTLRLFPVLLSPERHSVGAIPAHCFETRRTIPSKSIAAESFEGKRQIANIIPA